MTAHNSHAVHTYILIHVQVHIIWVNSSLFLARLQWGWYVIDQVSGLVHKYFITDGLRSIFNLSTMPKIKKSCTKTATNM